MQRFLLLFLLFGSLYALSLANASASETDSPQKRYVGDLLMVTYFESTGWCEVDFMNGHPAVRAICNFDIGKLQTVPSIETPEAIVHPLIFVHSISGTELVQRQMADGYVDAGGRKADWPEAWKLPPRKGAPAFIFCDWEGRILEDPPADLVLLMQTCADYVAANAVQIEADWQKLLVAREEWRRQAEIEAAKPKPPYQPPVFLKLEWEPGSGVPGKLRDRPASTSQGSTRVSSDSGGTTSVSSAIPTSEEVSR